MSKFKDLTGQKFGRLTVIKRIENNKMNNAQWLCKCDCGNDKDIIVTTAKLNFGQTKSCGCLGLEAKSRNGKLNKKYNTYDLSGEYGIGYTLKGEEFYFDLEDYDKIKDYCWYKHKGYIESTNKERKIIGMHQLIIDISNGEVIDHKNRIRHDNRKDNLRITTNSENAFNITKKKNNTSGVTGVFWEEQKEKWCASIYKNNKHVFRKYYFNKDDAIKARLKAELDYYDIAPQKHLFKKYSIKRGKNYEI
jgi:hypothetical protein